MRRKCITIMNNDNHNSDIIKSEAIKAIAEDLSVYVNLLTDFGFKRIFGIKEVMLNFLNAVLDIDGGIKDLSYDNTERLGLTKEDRKAIFDLICITGKGERIIVEMQTIPQEYFKDRILFYASLLIQEQNVKGKDWNFKLQPVYSINILNFCLDRNITTDKYFSYVQLIDRETCKLFNDKLTIACIELPRFAKELNKVKSCLEQWIFVIKHLHEMDSLPEALRNDFFENIFEVAKIAKMSKSEVYTYLKDLSDMNIVQNEIKRRDKIIDDHVHTIAVRDKIIDDHVHTIAQKDNTISAMEKENAELRRLLGLN